MAGGKVIGITVDIEGKSSGLTKALQEANASINKTASALKDVDKALELDPSNVELVAQKEALLAKQIEQTNEKLEIMQQVAQDANDALARGDITEEQYASLQAEIVKTSVSLEELEDAADESADELEETGDEAEDSGEAVETFGEAAEVAGEMAVAAFEAVVAAAAAVGVAIASAMAEAGTALVNATMDTSQLADELLTLSSTTGLSTDTLQELNYASELLDVSTETVTGSMTKLLKTMSSSNGAEKFAELGIAITDVDGNLRSTEDVFWEAIDVLGTYSNEAERDAASMEIFGKSARELNPLIEAGSGAFRDLAAEAHEVGYVMDGDTLDAFGALDDNMQRLSNTAEAVEHSFGQVLLPILTEMSGDAVDLMGDFSAALAGTEGDVDKIGAVIEKFAPQAVALVEQYIPKIITIFEKTFNAILPVIVSVVPQIITLAGEIVSSLALAIADNSDEFIEAFGTLFESLVDTVITLLPVLIPIAINLIETIVNALLDPANLEMLISGALGIINMLVEQLTNEANLEMLITAATTIITGLLNGLSQALPILIPAALNAILTIVQTLLDSGSLEQILQAALTLITTLAGALIDYLPELIARLPEIILGIVAFLTGDALPDLIAAGFTLITSIVANLPEIIVAIVEALVQLIAGMVEYITGDGSAELLENFGQVFMDIASNAITWGSDIVQGIIDGLMSMLSSLTSTLSDIASTIADYLGFSVPEKGPLHAWAFNNPGEDMMDLYSEGIEDGMNTLQNTIDQTANVINSGMGGSGAVQGSGSGFDSWTMLPVIQQALSSSGGGSGQIVIPVYIGSEHIDTIVMDAIDRSNFISGGY